MKTKRIVKYISIISIPSVLFLAPMFLLMPKPLGAQNTPNSSLNPNTQADAVSIISDISPTLVNNIGWVWPGDTFPGNDGYKYVSPLKNLIFTIDQNGVVFNPAFPKFSIPSTPAGTGDLLYDTMTQPIKIQSQKYDNAIRKVKPLETLMQGNLRFGAVTDDNFRSLVNSATAGNASYFLMDASQPYMEFEIPLISYQAVYFQGGHYQVPGPAAVHFSFAHSLVGNNAAMKEFTGKLTPIITDVMDGRHQKLIFDSESNDIHSMMSAATAKIKVFKDIGANPAVSEMHMITDGSNLNTVLPTITITKNKLDFTKGATQQNFNVENLIAAFNAQSLPKLWGAPKITAISDPVTASITFNYKPERVFVDGVLKEYTGEGASTVISGFVKMRTAITSTIGYPNTVIVDRFLGSIKKDNVIVVNELKKYLDLSSVPTDAVYTILDDYKIDFAAGIIQFNITASNGYYIDGTETKLTTPAYPITLQLTPRITKYSNIVGYPNDLDVDQVYTKFFNPATLEWNQTEFKKYHSVIAPVDNTKYYLVPGSYKMHTGDGTVSFQYYADKFYGLDGLEKVGDVIHTIDYQNDSLMFNPLASIVTARNVTAPNIRVDKFVDLVADNKGNITNNDLLMQYVRFENIPSGATYSIDLASVKYDPFNYDEFYDSVEFNLQISKYNEKTTKAGKIVTAPVAKTVPLRIKLASVHTETKIVARVAGEYDSSIRVDLLLPDIIGADGVVFNRPLLEKYIDIKSLPEDSTLRVRNITLTHSVGLLRFDVIPNISYGPDTKLLVDHAYPIELQLAIRYEPTIITVNTNIINPVRADVFAKAIQNAKNFDELINYIAPKYITVKGTFPLSNDQMKYKIADLLYDDLGNMSFNLTISDIYNENADVIKNVVYPVSLNLTPKYAVTQIDLINNYPQGISLTNHLIEIDNYKNDQPRLKDYLSNFLQGINTLPENSVITYNTLDKDETKGTTTFYISATTYYDSRFDEKIGYTSASFSLQLIAEASVPTLTTTIEWKQESIINGDARDFFGIVSPNNTIDVNLLSQYIEIKNVPLGAQITAYNKDTEFTSPTIIQLYIEVSQWWDDGVLFPAITRAASQSKFFNMERNLQPVVMQQAASTEFPWWWIVTAIILAAIIVIIGIYIKRHLSNHISR